ncbi:hypothetical protein [Lysinibacillus xylanilyticus]|uniref:hypothetical protein n=1 Tax=Lysinibacillus xylanilyticus TaxID=582475 RepID=UPI00380EA263
MEIPNEKCLKAILKFSESYNLTPPQSNDFGEWWRRAVNEMTNRDLQLYFFAIRGALNNGLGSQKVVSKMFSELERRKSEIDKSLSLI